MNWTKTPPTKPGAYWWKAASEDPPQVVILKPDGSCCAGWCASTAALIAGEWSSRLVPVEEVEKAYREGFDSGAGCFCDEAEPEKYVENEYKHSRARRVVEGEQQV